MDTKDCPDVLIRPPYVYLCALVLGIGLNFLFPLRISVTSLNFLALVFLVLGILLMMWCIRLFKKANTNLLTDRPATTLVISGPFRYSRNPGYIALNLQYVGIALFLNNIWLLLLALPLFMLVHTKIIIPEEQYLKQKFGKEYIEYTEKVRRWL